MDGMIYVLLNQASGAFYLGSTTQPRRRWNDHRNHLRSGTHGNAPLQEAWNADGEAAFVFSPIAVEIGGDVKDTEDRLLSRLVGDARCYNLSRSARGVSMEPTDATRSKISEALSGRPKSVEHRARIAAAHTGKKKSPDHCRALSEANRRRGPVSDATRAKMSAAHMGRECPMNGKKHSAESRAKISASLYARAERISGTR